MPVPKRPGASAPSAHLLIASSECARLTKGNSFRWQEGERCPHGVGMCVGMCGYTCVGVTGECALSWPLKPGVTGQAPALPLWSEKGQPHEAVEQLP